MQHVNAVDQKDDVIARDSKYSKENTMRMLAAIALSAT